MKVFLTGATGFIGTAVIPELHQAGHKVIGLTRSDAGAKSLAAAGVEPLRGDLTDLDSLRNGANKSDGVIHCGFIHDFSNFKQSCETDGRAIEAIGSVLAGSNRPLIVTGGLAGWAPGQPVTEDMEHPANSPLPRISEQTAMALRSKGVNASVMRLPQVHDTVKQGLITYLVAIARQKGVSAYIGEGRSRWAAAHVSDVARLYRLALENHQSGAKYHAVAEEGVPLRDIAEALGRGLKMPVVSIPPEQAAAHFGMMGTFVSYDIVGSSVVTRQRLGWNPTGPGLIADLDGMNYAAF